MLGQVVAELVRVIPEQGADAASSMTWLSLEYIVLQWSRLQRGSTRTAGALELFFYFLVLVGDIRMS